VKYRIKQEQDIVIIEVSGRVDSFTVIKMKEELHSLINAGKFNYILDLEAVEYLGSTALGVFIEAQEKAALHGGEVKLVASLNHPIFKEDKKIISKIFKTYFTEQEALQGFTHFQKRNLHKVEYPYVKMPKSEMIAEAILDELMRLLASDKKKLKDLINNILEDKNEQKKKTGT